MSFIIGIGIDIEKIERVKEMLDRWGDAFTDKVFTPAEIKYCSQTKEPAKHYTARFAAKEAFSKAIGTGWSEGFVWKNVEVERDDLGRPTISLYNEILDRLMFCNVHLSLSHADDYAAAVVVIEQINDR